MLVRAHAPILRELGLATHREPLLMRGGAGVVVEVFEWREGAIEAAHSHPEVGELWQQFGEVCDYEKLSGLPEASDLFATFKPLLCP